MNVQLEALLKEHFYYDTFREGQKAIIQDVLEGENVLGMLKTGSGKSLCYQLPAKLLSGMTIVVSPLISLMIDQVREAKAFHFKEVVALHSMQTWQERQAILRSLDAYKLLYISPELLQQEQLIPLFQQRDVSLIVIDEAHCISQWGHDFRPDYLRLKEIIQQLGRPPVLALTGTATESVQDDIQQQLQLHNMKKHIHRIDRENIALYVAHHENEDEKLSRLIEITKTYKTPTIVYFTSRKMTEQIASILQGNLPNRTVAYYHGGMDTSDRLKVQQQFLYDQIDIICCTSAFGMGINKSNIRLVVHYHIPADMESFIQEIGRAGRDGKESVSILLYKDGDIRLPLQMIEQDLPNFTELMYARTQLMQMQTQHSSIPAKDEDIEQLFQMKATKWHFLYFQLQTRGMMDKQIVLENVSLNEHIFREINATVQARIQAKRMKVMEMITYVQHEACLREKLYHNFNQEIGQMDVNCCSNCGFRLTDWSVEATTHIRVQHESWEDKLARLLLVKEYKDETIGNH